MTELEDPLHGRVSAASPMWTATRCAGLARLTQFIPQAGEAYAQSRNYDVGMGRHGSVSCLSPWLRHRVVLEEEVIAATLAAHSYRSAEKFLQEVFWRTYFKGWLEQHPSVWRSYRADVERLVGQLESYAGKDFKRRYDTAIAGKTGIGCFDAWVAELSATGYLHNHARMWFASIWIFTLRLPWQLGADFFYRHLLDGDPASNTLSWRWVGGLHTKGKTYLARPSNIQQFTNQRFDPAGQLATEAKPIDEAAAAPLIALPATQEVPLNRPYVLLITPEDGVPESLSLPHPPSALAVLSDFGSRSPLPIGDLPFAFTKAAMKDIIRRAELHFGLVCLSSADIGKSPADDGAALVEFARQSGADTVVTAYAPVGPVADAVRQSAIVLDKKGIRLVQIQRRLDTTAWPHATKGFFKLRKKIPGILTDLGLARGLDI